MVFGYDIITIGGATEDLFFTVDDYTFVTKTEKGIAQKLMVFEYGTKIGVPDVTSAYGGGANNVAVQLAHLGFRVAMISTVGRDGRGQGIIRNLEKHRVVSKFLQKTDKASTGVSFILVQPGHDHIVFTHRGANDHLVIDRKARREIKKAKGVYLTSLSGNWKKVLPSIFSANKNIAWNPGRLQIAAGLRFLSPFLKQTRILICNKDEALDLVNSHSSRKITDLRAALRELKKYVIGCVVITNGEKGVVAYDGQKYYSEKAKKVKKVVDTTGVGDAFGASFLAGIKKYRGDIEPALELAADNSALVLGHMGAQTGLEDIRRF